MKRKNFWLAIGTFVLAIGSAFASLLIPEPAWVFAQTTENGPFVCMACENNVRCFVEQPIPCRVTVLLQNGSFEMVRARRPSLSTVPCAVTNYNTDLIRLCYFTAPPADVQ